MAKYESQYTLFTKALTLQGFFIDKEDLDTYGFKFAGVTGNKYLTIDINGKHEYLHRLIAGASGAEHVDHINGNTLDNRKLNLRKATVSQNGYNKGMRSDNTSGYKGVSWNRSRDKYEAYIHLKSKLTGKSYKKQLGRFSDVAEAAAAYNKAAIRYYGEFARLNVIE